MSGAEEKPGANARTPGSRQDNYQIYRPEAVKAYSLRRAGEPWDTRLRFEGSLIVGLTLLAIIASVALLVGGR
jgi:hypothetical protein